MKKKQKPRTMMTTTESYIVLHRFDEYMTRLITRYPITPGSLFGWRNLIRGCETTIKLIEEKIIQIHHAWQVNPNLKGNQFLMEKDTTVLRITLWEFDPDTTAKHIVDIRELDLNRYRTLRTKREHIGRHVLELMDVCPHGQIQIEHPPKE